MTWPNYGLDVLNITMHTELAIHSMNAYMCGVGAKSVAHLMKFHLLKSKVVKVKFLTVLKVHQKTDPKVQQDFKGQGHYDKVKGQIKVIP